MTYEEKIEWLCEEVKIMSKELKKITPLELLKNFLLLVEAPAKARLLDCEWKDGLEQYNFFKSEIENALKNYEELTSKPVILCGRTHAYSQTLIDYICKNYKEVKITNLEDEKKLKAFDSLSKEKEKVMKELSLEIEKNKALNEILTLYGKWAGHKIGDYPFFVLLNDILDKYDLLKEV